MKRTLLSILVLQLVFACGDGADSETAALPEEARCDAPAVTALSPVEAVQPVRHGDAKEFSIAVAPTGFGEKTFVYEWRINGRIVANEQSFVFLGGDPGGYELKVGVWECDDSLEGDEQAACLLRPPFPEGVTVRTWFVKVEP